MTSVSDTCGGQGLFKQYDDVYDSDGHADGDNDGEGYGGSDGNPSDTHDYNHIDVSDGDSCGEHKAVCGVQAAQEAMVMMMIMTVTSKSDGDRTLRGKCM